MLEFKKLKTDIELQEFCNNYHHAISKKSIKGFELTLDSIKKKEKVIGVFQHGKMIAGYAISNVPYPLLANITEENRIKMEQISPLGTCYDLGNIWKKNGFSKGLFNSVVWPRIVLDTLTFNFKKKNIIGYVFTGHGRADSYNLAKPIFLQTSPVKNELNIFVMTRRNLAIGLVKGITEETISRPLGKMTRKLLPILTVGQK